MAQKASKSKQSKRSSKKSSEKKSNGYIMQKYRVNADQLAFVQEFIQHLSLQDGHLFCHILISHLIDPWKEYIPISAVLLRESLPGASLMGLVDRGWGKLREWVDPSSGETKTYSVALRLSQEIKLLDWIVEKFVALGVMPPEERIKATKYNLFTGKPIKDRLTNQKYDENRNPEPPLITSAMDLIHNCPYNARMIEKVVEARFQNMLEAEREFGKASPEYKSARGSYFNDRTCFNSLLDQTIGSLTEDIKIYSPCHRVQMSGRVSHLQGGIQSASREMKAAAFEEVDQVKNYDLKSSQIVGLIQQFEFANQYGGLQLSTKWLEDYRDDSEAKVRYAAMIGITEDCWKKCLCALMCYAWLPSNSKSSRAKLEQLGSSDAAKSAILDYLLKEANGNVDLAFEYVIKFHKAVAPFYRELEKWGNWLHDVYSVGKSYLGRSGDRFIKNPTGKTLNVTQLKKEFSRGDVISKMIAFILQGQEAAFIHELTCLSLRPEYNYQVVGNEHDGLITIGSIPPEAVEEASRLSGLQNAVLVEKLWVSALQLEHLIGE